MSTPTIIRFKTIADGFAVVVTTLSNKGLDARVQEYAVTPNGGRTVLNAERSWSDEGTAIADWEGIFK